MRHDVAVVGLGAMGAAAALAFARRGASVIAIDRYSPPHALGSTHGHTRIIREAYYEHPLYVPLVRRAYELWEELEREADATVFLRTGGVMVGPENGPLVSGALASARAHGIPHELLDAAELRRRFPAYRASSEWVALLEQRAGMLRPERCVELMHARAAARGATLNFGELAVGWRANGRGVVLETTRARYDVDRIVVAIGAWLPELTDSLGVHVPVEIERQLSHWFEPHTPDAKYGWEHCPVGLWEAANGEVFATLPDEGHGVKCGMHHDGATTTAAGVDRRVAVGEDEAARAQLEAVMPGAGGRLRDARVCLYTNTPDRHFIIDWLPGDRVLLLSPCSGHGFKFASAIGEIAAELTLSGRTWLDLSPFSLRRFSR